MQSRYSKRIILPMRTIFITSFHSIISRNILATKTLDILKEQPDIKIVLLVPDYKTDYFESQFGGKNINVEGVVPNQATKKKSGVIFKRLSWLFYDNESAAVRRQYKYFHDKKLGYYTASLFFGFLGRSSLLRKILRFADYTFSPRGIFIPLINKYNPDLIFSTDVQNENDVALLQDAKRSHIKTVGMIRSWDNPSKFTLRIFPDLLLVGSKTLKDEVVFFHKYKPDKIIVVGKPHYDRYLEAPIKSRNDFFFQFNLDPQKRLILYAPLGDDLIFHNDFDQFIMEILADIGTQVIVRYPPDSAVHLENFDWPSNMAVDVPGHVFNTNKYGNREIPLKDDSRLIDSLYYSDIVITSPTSIILDAIFLDKPVIVADFYPSSRHKWQGIFGYYYYHFDKLLRTGGFKFVKSRADFKKAIEVYLNNPKEDFLARKRVRELWFSHDDGMAGARLAHVLLESFPPSSLSSIHP